MRSIRFVVTSCLLAVAACNGDLAPVASTQPAIEQGKIDNGDPAVGYLTGLTAGGTCTAVLIDPNWIISAGHCRQHDEKLTFWTGSSAADLVPHDIVDGSYLYEPASWTLLMKLASPIYTINPVQLGRTLPSIGTSCRAVGFNLHDEPDGTLDGAVQKRDGWETVTQLPDMAAGEQIIHVKMDDAIADHGDSGGPLICSGTFVDGLVYGHDPNLEWPNYNDEMYTIIPFDWLQRQTGGVLSSCTPRTCADQNGMCGTIADFCGGTLDCGGCGSNAVCAMNHCCATENYDPTTGECGGGAVTCPRGFVDCGGACCRCRKGTCS